MTIGMSTQNNQNTIYRKSRNYGCNTHLWDASVNEYWELFTQKKRICPNRVNNNKPTTTTAATTTNRSTYYSKKPWSNTPKPKMSNSFEYLQGSITEIQKKYEICMILLHSMKERFMVLKGI